MHLMVNNYLIWVKCCVSLCTFIRNIVFCIISKSNLFINMLISKFKILYLFQIIFLFLGKLNGVRERGYAHTWIQIPTELLLCCITLSRLSKTALESRSIKWKWYTYFPRLLWRLNKLIWHIVGTQQMLLPIFSLNQSENIRSSAFCLSIIWAHLDDKEFLLKRNSKNIMPLFT